MVTLCRPNGLAVSNLVHALNLRHVLLSRVRLEQFSRLGLVVSHRLKRKIHICESIRVFPDLSIYQSQTQIERDPANLISKRSGDILWIKDQRILNRHPRTAAASNSHPKKPAFKRVNLFNPDTSLKPCDK